MKTRRTGLTVIALSIAIAAVLGAVKLYRSFAGVSSGNRIAGPGRRRERRAPRAGESPRLPRAGRTQDTTAASRWIPADLAHLPR